MSPTEEASQVFIFGLWHSFPCCYIMGSKMQDFFVPEPPQSWRFYFFQLQVAQKYYFLVTN